VKNYKRRYIWNKKTLIVNKVVNLIAAREGSYYNNGEKPIKRVRAVKHCGHCGHCGKKGHNSRTCIVEIKDVDDSDIFKE